ncbi:LCP family protein [Vagococcus entomophilus]|uniref:Cell envelope-related transcriptional attenuator domain-containing protein n=1 Tax=Vagococcus entomophilus TaxID=1160095 RepID=A0A430AGN4_9ENTE|nr:LCP family protein [Vagococcus entomophilus]RSU07061.1 hypothetical protein CBF30_07330 [Vagococcus entomophilus]
MGRRVNQKRKRKRGKKVFLFILLSLLVAGTGYAMHTYQEMDKVLKKSYTKLNVGKQINQKEASSMQKKAFSVLIMGLDDDEKDERGLGSSRTDSMILASVNPTKSEGKVDITTVSIPRDTYLHINSTKKEGYAKINSAYMLGGNELAVKTVNQLLDTPIDYFLTVDFHVLVKLVDELGGITVDVPFDIYANYASSEDPNSGDLLIPKGSQHLNGAQALVFSRIRKVDDDIKRGERQQQIVQAIIAKVANIKNIPKMDRILSSLNGHFKTNIKTNEIMSLFKMTFDKKISLEPLVFKWEGGNADTMFGQQESVVYLYKNSLDYVRHKLLVNLDLEKSDQRDQKNYEPNEDGTVSEKTPKIDNNWGGNY